MCCGELGTVGMDRMDSDFDFIFIIISFLAQNEIETKIFLKVLSILSICML
jgi:hypothetical protein